MDNKKTKITIQLICLNKEKQKKVDAINNPIEIPINVLSENCAEKKISKDIISSTINNIMMCIAFSGSIAI